jgi:hypothetical protein
MTDLTYGDYTINTSDIPEAVILKMLNASFAHILGNEVDSSVVARKRKAIVEAKGNGAKAADVTRDEIEAWSEVEGNAEVIEGWRDELRLAKLEAIRTGQLLVRVARAVTRDPIEAFARKLAQEEVIAILERTGIVFEKGGKKTSVFLETMFTIGETEATGDELIDRRLAREGERIRKLAARKVEEDRKVKEATVKATQGKSSALAELGLA